MPASAAVAGGVGLPDPSGAVANPNATIVVPVGATEMGLRPAAVASRDGSLRPRLRSGWALKRLDDEADQERYVLRDLREGTFLRMSEQDAQLLELLDGKRSVAELLVEASERLGPEGPGRLARLIADFGERGMLDGVAPTPVRRSRTRLLRACVQDAGEDVRLDPRVLPDARTGTGAGCSSRR